MKRGYYLVTPDGERRFISKGVAIAALGRACEKYLTAETGWQYWIDFCFGLDVHDCPAWLNLDCTDQFF
jgi:hypothetical protein